MIPKGIGKIGVLAGGPSSEREISLESGRAVFNALKTMGYDAVFLDVNRDLEKGAVKAFGIDVAFIALHGKFGEDGTIQQMLEELKIPYTGSGPSASRLALDKIASKDVFIASGLETPRHQVFTKKDFDASKITTGYPLVVKPQFEGSSIGISIVEKAEGIRKAAEAAFKYGDNILIEEYIDGREITVGLLDDDPLPVVEIVVGEKFYDFKAKYKSDCTRYVAPAQIPPEAYNSAQKAALAAHRALGCRGFSRVDMLLDAKSRKIFVLEVNSIPGLTSHSLLPKAAACVGIDFGSLCLKIIRSSLNNKEVSEIGKAKQKV